MKQVIGGKIVELNEDGMYPMSFFSENFDTSASRIMRKKGFLERVEAITGKNVRSTPNIVRALKDAGLYKTRGRRGSSKSYCDKAVFYILLDMISMDFRNEMLREYMR